METLHNILSDHTNFDKEFRYTIDDYPTVLVEKVRQYLKTRSPDIELLNVRDYQARTPLDLAFKEEKFYNKYGYNPVLIEMLKFIPHAKALEWVKKNLCNANNKAMLYYKNGNKIATEYSPYIHKAKAETIYILWLHYGITTEFKERKDNSIHTQYAVQLIDHYFKNRTLFNLDQEVLQNIEKSPTYKALKYQEEFLEYSLVGGSH